MFVLLSRSSEGRATDVPRDERAADRFEGIPGVEILTTVRELKELRGVDCACKFTVEETTHMNLSF
jgi:hypothetical protein